MPARESISSIHVSFRVLVVAAVLTSGGCASAAHADMPALEKGVAASQRVLDRLEDTIEWNLPLVFREPPACYHGGAFFDQRPCVSISLR